MVFIMQTWLTEDLKQKVKNIYEPRYKRKLSDTEAIHIAENLSEVIEILCKFKWRTEYENKK